MRPVEKCYRLPMQAMLAVVQSSAARVLLLAQPPALPGISKRECVVHLVLGQGAVSSCQITDAVGTVLAQNQEAYQVLLRCGDLEWQVMTLHEQKPTVVSRVPRFDTREQASREASMQPSVPTLRITPLPPETLASLSHPYRMLLVLVDGKRSIDQLARLLSKSPAAIHQMLATVPHRPEEGEAEAFSITAKASAG
ncbi:MAG TPA: hypothetical protein VFV38_00530 [Ktedonobacteraceae bacterium]|nr:hypothetical protein [Ktedonobacteraceae bacterium]